MRRLGLVARADQGGIAAQTWQFARRMRPERILVVHTEHRTRGVPDPEMFRPFCEELRTTRRSPTPQDVFWLTHNIDTLFTVECWYGPGIPQVAFRQNVKTVIQANPEMSGAETADVWLAPTDWRLDLLQGSNVKVLPFPTDPELFPCRALVSEPSQLYHIASPAMLDRNGTETFCAALPHVQHGTAVMIRDPEGARDGIPIGRASVFRLGHDDRPTHEVWGDVYPDLFVLPRRYGGLCLPIQEAATLGLPIITTDMTPQASWLPPESLVPTVPYTAAQMRGGHVELRTCDPVELAQRINTFIEQPELTRRVAQATWEWADSISWDRLKPAYEGILR